jgi:ribosome-associated protein
MYHLYDAVFLDEREIDFSMIRAQGSGGQNVNKVSSAVHLRFDIRKSSLPEECKASLMAIPDRRLSKDGVIVIKAQSFRSQEKNRSEATERLIEMIRAAVHEQALRKPTRPTRASQRRRVQRKTLHGEVKRLRAKVGDFH